MAERASKWFEERSPVWTALSSDLRKIDGRARVAPQEALAAVRVYPEIARDLAIARRFSPGGALTRHLEQIYLQAHRLVFRKPIRLREELIDLFLREAAGIVRSLRGHILWVTLLFILSAGAGYWLVATYPELAALFASEEMIDTVASGQLWTDSLMNVVPSAVLSVGIFTNNIVVALVTFCLGALYGLGTLYIIGLNGLLLGSVFAMTAQYGQAGRLFQFVAAHGFVELSVICIAGAAGASLGEALARPGGRTRSEAFRDATARGARLLVVCAALLVGAGLIEGYISPNPAFALPVRLMIGLGYWVFMLALLTGRFDLRGRPDSRPTGAHENR